MRKIDNSYIFFLEIYTLDFCSWMHLHESLIYRHHYQQQKAAGIVN